MSEFLFASNNPGKLAEVSQFSANYGWEVKSPRDVGLDINPEETGSTFEENSKLKLEAFLNSIDDPELLVAADDSGIAIDALDGEPGLYSRRWKGYEMSDDEIIDYCLERMADIPEGQRTARFVSVVAYGRKGEEPKFVTGEVIGDILKQPVEAGRIEGFPFRALFYVSDVGKMLYEVHDTPLEERPGYLTHRERAFKNMFEALRTQ